MISILEWEDKDLFDHLFGLSVGNFQRQCISLKLKELENSDINGTLGGKFWAKQRIMVMG